jgi:hypothetical protein
MEQAGRTPSLNILIKTKYQRTKKITKSKGKKEKKV